MIQNEMNGWGYGVKDSKNMYSELSKICSIANSGLELSASVSMLYCSTNEK